MVANERLGVLGRGVADEGADTGPSREDVTTTDLDVGAQVATDLVEDPLDLLLLGNGVLVDVARRVGGTSDDVTLPGKEEDDTAVRGGRVEQTHGLGAVVVLYKSVNVMTSVWATAALHHSRGSHLQAG